MSVPPLASIVDGEALLDTVVASLVAGVGVTLIASLAIYGFATYAEMRREERGFAAGAAAALASIATLAFAGTIAIGLIVMISG